ncbi:MAG: hypothetical protein JXR63_02955 [Spirochaetales bacterium]|nr:hypothetical protein [Spirochaetales bacterium]
MEKKYVFEIVSINTSEKRGIPKTSVSEAVLVEGMGIEDDAHFGAGHRQISLLAYEDFLETEKVMKENGMELEYGAFAENILTRGVAVHQLPVGTVLHLGEAIVRVTQIGKECHNGCVIQQITGNCIMPKRGIFVEVIKGGKISNESSCYYSL